MDLDKFCDSSNIAIMNSEVVYIMKNWLLKIDELNPTAKTLRMTQQEVFVSLSSDHQIALLYCDDSHLFLN